MRAISLGSGSKGNCTLIASASTALLVDAGFGVKDTFERLEKVGYRPDQLSGILITHEHGDHAQGANRLARTWSLPLYASQGTSLGAKLESPQVIKDMQRFKIGDISVLPVLVSHDAREPTQFVFESNDFRLGICTDLGCVTPHVVKAFQSLDALLLEANYDPEMLAGGPYPPKLKARVGGDYGHLSNQQSAQLLSQLVSDRLQRVVACHLSEKNNTPEHVRAQWTPWVPPHTEFTIASQTDGCEWIDLMELAHG